MIGLSKITDKILAEARADADEKLSQAEVRAGEIASAAKVRAEELCAKIDEAAKQRMNLLIPLMAQQAGVTEKLKDDDPMAWTQMMNGLKAQAEEFVFQELIYS